MPAHNSAGITVSAPLGCPEGSSSPTQPMSPAGCPVQVLLAPWFEPQKKLKRILPQTYRFCSSSAHRKITKCHFAAFFCTHYKCKHIWAHLYFCLPEPGTLPGEGLAGHAGEEKLSALRKRCNKSTPVREKCPQKQTAHEQTVSVRFIKLTLK